MDGILHWCKWGRIGGAIGAAILWWLTMFQPAFAQQARLEIDQLRNPLATMESISVSLDWPETASAGTLVFTAKTLSAEEFGYRWRNLKWQCELQRQALSGWQCAGRITGKTGASIPDQGQAMRLSMQWTAEGLDIQLLQGKNGIRLSQHEENDPRIQLIRIPISWLTPLLAQAWPEGRFTGGELDGDWQLQLDDVGVGFSGTLHLANLGVDSLDGTVAAEGLKAAGQVSGQLDDTTQLALNLDWQGGEFLLGPLYVALPDTPVQFQAQIATRDGNRWQMKNMRWNDPGVLSISGQAVLDMEHDIELPEADIQVDLPNLKTAHARYFDSLAASFGLQGLAVTGAMQARLVQQSGQWQRIDTRFEAVSVEDQDGRFGLEKLDGEGHLQRASTPVASQLSWQRAHLHGLQLGAAQMRLQSAEAGVALRDPLSIPLFGGTLDIKTFRYQPQRDDLRLDVALALNKVDLGALSTAMDWPPFGGSISGDLPAVRYAGNRLDFEGGLTVSVFDGQVTVSQLAMERPFGVAPMLAASVAFSDLDLQPLTSAFGFGEITGRLAGHIRDLRLLDWEPVAFDAAFHTEKRKGVKRQISQRAVNDLTEVGGGGIAAGLQAQVLKAFSSFGYDRIGLSCVLSNNVCRMGGVAPADAGGYIIVEGAGLPRVSVVGHQKQVDWPVLLARLKAASEGQAPRID